MGNIYRDILTLESFSDITVQDVSKLEILVTLSAVQNRTMMLIRWKKYTVFRKRTRR